MIVLDATTKSLEIVLAGTVTTSQLPVVVSYTDFTVATGGLAVSEADSATNNTTAVTILAAPGAGVTRVADLITVYNKDTASATVTVRYNDNATLRELVKQVLSPGQTLQYTRNGGWQVVSPFSLGSGNTDAGTLRVVVATDDTVKVNGSAVTQPVSASSLPLPTGAATEGTLGGVLKEGTDITGASLPAGGASGRGWLSAIWKSITDRLPASLTGSGNLKVALAESTASQAVTGTFWQTTQPVSAASLPLPTGAAQDRTANLNTGAGTDTRAAVGLIYASSGGGVLVSASNPLPVTGGGVAQASTTSGQTGPLVQGAVTTGAPTYTAGQTSPLSMDGQGQLRGVVSQAGTWNVSTVSILTSLNQWAGNAIDTGSGNKSAGTLRVVLATDQPALTNALLVSQSGTWTVQQGGAPWSVAQSGTWTVQPGNTANTTPWLVQASQNGSWSVDTELPAAAALADGAGNPTTPLVGACATLWNGSTWDRRTGTLEGTAFVSATRTASVNSGNINNRNCRGVVVWLSVTGASGTGGLTLQFQGIDPVSGNILLLNAAPTAITATGTYGYELGPGSSTAGTAGNNLVQQRTSGQLPRTWRIVMIHGDASNYTYSVGYCLIP